MLKIVVDNSCDFCYNKTIIIKMVVFLLKGCGILRKWKSFYVTDEDENIINFIRAKFGGHVSVGYAIKEALKRYARMCGYKEPVHTPASALLATYDIDMKIAKIKDKCLNCAKEHNVECPAFQKIKEVANEDRLESGDKKNDS